MKRIGNKLQMHDLLRDMGREIVRQESPKEAGKRSRLWHHRDSFTVLKEKIGTETIQGLVLDMRLFKEVDAKEQFDNRLLADSGNQMRRRKFGFLSPHRSENSQKLNDLVLENCAFEGMHNLRLLRFSNVRLIGCYKDFPKRLRVLHWCGFPLDSIPIDFLVESLVVLEMEHSSLKKAWTGIKFLGHLEILNLSHSYQLLKTPDFRQIPSLERLVLEDCISLVYVHESIGSLKKLVFLDLKDCKSLKKLPQSITMLTSLETLIISGCFNLLKLPEDLQKLESLKVFDMAGIATSQLLMTRGEEKSWGTFVWSLVSNQRRSPEISWSCLPHSLVKLSIAGCYLTDDAFPRAFSELSSLQKLDLSKNLICYLPNCFRDLPRLMDLTVVECPNLQSLLDLPPNLEHLYIYGCQLLERFRYKSIDNPDRGSLVFSLDNKIVEFASAYKIEPITDVDAEIINILGLPDLTFLESLKIKLTRHFSFPIKLKGSIQGIHERGLFNTFYPVTEVPRWFSHKSSLSAISVVITSLPNQKVRGINVYALYAYAAIDIENVKLPQRDICAKIESKGRKWIRSPLFYALPGQDEDMIWLSHWNIGKNWLEVGDEVSVSIIGRNGVKVKGCGINVVMYEEEEIIHNSIMTKRFLAAQELKPGYWAGQDEICWEEGNDDGGGRVCDGSTMFSRWRLDRFSPITSSLQGNTFFSP